MEYLCLSAVDVTVVVIGVIAAAAIVVEMLSEN